MARFKFIAAVLFCAAFISASGAMALNKSGQQQEKQAQQAEEEVTFDDGDKPTITPTKKTKAKKAGVKEVEGAKSIEAPPPPPPAGLNAGQLQMLSDILAATQLENAQFQLETLQLKRAEQRNKLVEAMNPEAAAAKKKGAEKEEKEDKKQPTSKEIARVFPMPGGNPQVVSILGGNKKALEATLIFPSGLRYEVGRGTVLEGGYRVAKVSNNGVVLEKDGVRLSMPISGGSMKGKPWDNGQEMGTPIGGQRMSMPLQDSATVAR